jgi:prefoldin subunit 5
MISINIQSLQASFATKTELHDATSSISKDLRTLKDNQNHLFDALKQMSNDTRTLENRVTALEAKTKNDR